MNLGEAKKFWDDLSGWSQQTFGTDAVRGPAGPLKHLLKEAQEALTAPDRQSLREEIVDCQFLVFDAARREGMTVEELFLGCFRKLEKNRQRSWPMPSTDEPVEHIRAEGER